MSARLLARGIAVLVTAIPLLVYGQVYKCVDPQTKKTTYSGTPCASGEAKALSITDNAVMDGSAAQREIARRKAEESADAATRASVGMERQQQEQQRQSEGDVYNKFRSKQRTIGRVETKRQATELASAALETQRADAVGDTLHALAGKKSQAAVDAREALEDCKAALGRGDRCVNTISPPIARPKIPNGAIAPSATSLSAAASGPTLCADGSYVSRGPCKLCPNGRYAGNAGCQLAPDGTYVTRTTDGPRLAPNGRFIEGGHGMTLCPDGSYVAGSRCVLAPNGRYVGG
jgi:hypothetical protein